MRLSLTVILISIGVIACGDTSNQSTVEKPDDTGATAEKHAQGKSDAWNRRNNPAGLRIELNKKLAELPLEGEADNPAWPDTYWPAYKDSTNARWQSTGNFLDDLSPAEKFDAAFNHWDPFSVEELKPFSANNCDPESFDATYYDHLGPLAHYVSEYKGNKKTRTAVIEGALDEHCTAKPDSQCIIDCGDEPSDDENENRINFDRCIERCDRGGVETWWGSCHAWAPAAILEKEPLYPVTIPTEYGDITFEVGDIKALFSIAYDRTQAALIGGRCNDFEVKRDEKTGRIINENCRDLNAGAFHVSMTNLLGIQRRGFVEDRTFDYEVWNQPVKGFEVKEMEEISIERAHELLNVDAASPTDCHPDFSGEEDAYCYNSNIDTLLKVKTTLHWLTESQASTHALGHQHLARYARTDTYDYILEVKDGEVVGGEWFGDSIRNHPDFIWLPFSHGALPRKFEIEHVRMLNRLAQLSPEERAAPKLPVTRESGELNLMIPDNSTRGISTPLSVEGSLLNDIDVVLKVTVDIKHTYSGDLKISLTSPDGKTRVLRNREGGSTDDIHQTFELPFTGVVDGDWVLEVSDMYAQDLGSLVSWALVAVPPESEGSSESSVLQFENTRQAVIPDNEPTGINSYIDVDADGSIEHLEVSLDIAHTYIGDLIITLSKGGVSQIIHNREGGSDNDLKRTITTSAFKGMPMSGRWFLKVVDRARHDEGTRQGWTLKFNE